MGAPRDLGRYEILKQIGEGGMAVVHLARQIDLDRLVALKELNAIHVEDRSWASRFLRESRLAGSMTHANIVTVYDYFEVGGTPYIAMEYLEHGSLRPYVASLEPAQIGGVLRDVLAGIQHAERQQVVHRDLKPENLLVTADGQVKIADFGIAKATTNLALANFQTEAGIAVGTPGYMAPEQAMARDIGTWSDLYALGCMAYEMCTGALPFTETIDPFALMLRHLSEPIASAKTVRPGVDPALSDWIDSLLVKEPSERVQTGSDAWETLDEILYDGLGPRWQRGATLSGVAAAGTTPVARFTSAVLDPAEFAERLDIGASPEVVPDALPGPYTPPPGDAIVSAEIAALDPSPEAQYLSVDVVALNAPPRPLPESTYLTPPPNLPIAGVAAMNEPEPGPDVAGASAPSALPDAAGPDEARPEEARPDEARPDLAEPDEARPDLAEPAAARPRGAARPGGARRGSTRRGPTA